MALLRKLNIADVNLFGDLAAATESISLAKVIEPILARVKAGEVDVEDASEELQNFLSLGREEGEQEELPEGEVIEPESWIEWERSNLTLIVSGVISGIVSRNGLEDMHMNAEQAWEQARVVFDVGRRLMTTSDGDVSYLISQNDEPVLDAKGEATLG